ncbi:uncharacterized protein LOC144688501 [Cetorhinus maximus]
MEEMKRSGRVVHITDLPHDGYTEDDITKLTQPFGKVAAIKLVRTKNEAFLEMAYKEAAVALVEFYSITPVEINHRQVTMTLLGRKKQIHKQPDQKEQSQSQVFPPVQKDISAPVTSAGPRSASETAPPSADTKIAGGDGTAAEKADSENVGLNVKGRVIRINNLPARGYKEDDLKRLAKPFGQVLNVVITFSRNQAYLEMACAKAAEKMVEFYSLSTIKLKGNAISMQVLHQYVDLSDMEVIFKDIIEESGFKPDAGCTIYDHFVHISNLPEDGYTEVDILCVAFRFGRVKDSMFLKPHNKVLLQLESGNAATSMCSFFREIPHDFHGKTLEFSLSPKAGAQSGNEEKAVEGSCDATAEPEAMEIETSGSAQTKESDKTDVKDDKAGKSESDETTSDSAKPTVVVTPAAEMVAKTAGETIAQNLVTATVNEPSAHLKPSVTTASARNTPLTTKSPIPAAAETPADVLVKPVASNSAGATTLGKPTPASTAAKPASMPAKPAAATTGTSTKPAVSAVNAPTKPAPTTSSVTPLNVVTKPITTSLATKPGQTVTTAATKPSPATGSATAKSSATGVNAASKSALTPAAAASKPIQTPTQAASKSAQSPTNATPKSTAVNAASKAPAPATASAVTRPTSTTTNVANSPSAASGTTPSVVTTTSSPAAEKANPQPATTPPAAAPVGEATTPATAEKAATPASSSPPKTSVPPPTATKTAPPKSVVAKPGSRESSASKLNGKKVAPAKKEHLAKEPGKPSTPARGRSTSRDRSNKEGSGRSTLSHQKEKDSRPERRHVPQHLRDKDHKSSTRSKTTSERSSKDRKTSSKIPKKEAEKDIFPFNLDEFVTVDEVGEEEETSGNQIPESKSETNDQPSEKAEPEATKAETTQKVKEPEPAPAPAPAPGDAPMKAVEPVEVKSKPAPQPNPETQPQPELQPQSQAAVKEEPMETESETTQEQPSAPEPSKAQPVADSKEEATGTTAVKKEAAPSLGGDGEPSRKKAGQPSSQSPAPASSVSSGGDSAKSTSLEQRADAKLRREPTSEVEPEAKRMKLGGPALAEFKMPPYKPSSPIGVEFIVPKTGYFCQICSLFYTNEDTAKVTHCGTVLHYKNMEKYVTQRQEELRKQQERMAKQDK